MDEPCSPASQEVYFCYHICLVVDVLLGWEGLLLKQWPDPPEEALVLLYEEGNLLIVIFEQVLDCTHLESKRQVFEELIDFLLLLLVVHILYLEHQLVVQISWELVIFVDFVEEVDPLLILCVLELEICYNIRQCSRRKRERQHSDELNGDAEQSLWGIRNLKVAIPNCCKGLHHKIAGCGVQSDHSHTHVVAFSHPVSVVALTKRFSNENPEAPNQMAHEKEHEEEEAQPLILLAAFYNSLYLPYYFLFILYKLEHSEQPSNLY